MTLVAGVDGPGPMVPKEGGRDRVLPILVAASLIVHVTVGLPSLLGWHLTNPAKPAPKEVTVDLVQLPPEPPKPKQQPAKPQPKAEPPKPHQAKAEPPKAEPPKPAPKREARREQPKPPAPKPQQQPRQEPPKPQQASVADRMKQLLGPIPPGMDATPLPGQSAFGTESASYTQLVLSQVAKAKKEGRFRGTPGAASVSFTVGDGGEVASVEIAKPSGDATLDAEAIAMIRRAAPFPPPPPGGRRDYTVTLVFKLT